MKRASKVEQRFPVKVRASAATFVHDHIVSMLFAGEVRGGDRIDQDALSVELGVSRIPIREGLIQLEREGIVTIDYNRGAYLATFDASTIREHFELYGLLSGHASAAAARSLDVATLRKMADIVDELRHSTDPFRCHELASEFRRLVHIAGGGVRLHTALRLFGGYVPADYFFAIPGAAALIADGLAAELSALRARRGRSAASAVWASCREQGDLVVAHLIVEGVFEAAPSS